MKIKYFQMVNRNPLIYENLEDKRTRHDMESLALFKNLSEDTKKGLDQLRNLH